MKLRFSLVPLFATLVFACSDSTGDGSTGAKSANEVAQAPQRSVADIFGAEIAPQGVLLSPIPEPPALDIPASEQSTEDLTISAVRPRGDLGSARTIAITFSKPVAALVGTEVQAPPQIATIEPALEGEWRWLGSTTAEFTPAQPFPHATEFKITVPEGIQAIDGSKLDAPFEFSFTTLRPKVQAIYPLNDALLVDLKPNIAIITNQPVANLPEKVKLSVTGGSERKLTLKRSLPQVEYEREQEKARGNKVDETSDIDPLGPTRYEFTIQGEPLPKLTRVCIEADKGILGKGQSAEPLSTEKAQKSCFTTYGDQAIHGVYACGNDTFSQENCPTGPLYIAMNNPVDLDDLKTKLHVSEIVAAPPSDNPDEPGKDVENLPIEINWDFVSTSARGWRSREESSTSWVRVRGAFKPGKSYQVTLDPGLKDQFGQTAEKGIDGATVKMSDRDPNMFIGDKFALLERTSDRTIPIYTVNAEATDAKLWRLTAEEFAQQQAHKIWSNSPRPTPAAEPINVRVNLSGRKNESHFVPLALDPVLTEDEDGKKHGFVMASIEPLQKTKWSRPDIVLAQVTDLAVHVHIGPQDGLAWVTSLSQGTPVPDATIRVLKYDGTDLWKGKTDASGLVKLPGVVKLTPEDEESGLNGLQWNGPEFLVVASKDGDEGAVWTRWNDGIETYSFDTVYGDWEGPRPSENGVLFSDRGIYRPGDTVYFRGISRYYKNGALYNPAENARVKVEVEDTSGKTIHKDETKLSAYGTYGGSFQLPSDRPLGRYRIKTQIRQSKQWTNQYASFRVEEYRAPQFQVDVTSPNAQVIAGENVQASVLSRYLFGGAMAGASIDWSAHRYRTSVSIKGQANKDYAFGLSSWGWDDDNENTYGSVQAGKGKGKADSMGAFQIDLGKGITQGGVPFEYNIEADVSDVNRQRVAGRTSVTVHPASAYAGLKLDQSGFLEAGKTGAVQVVAADIAGEWVEGMNLSAKILRRDWKNIRKKGVGGEWFFESTSEKVEVKACHLVSAKEPVTCEFIPEKPGAHLAEVTLKDASGRTQISQMSFYVVGEGGATWKNTDDKRLDLVPDQEIYDVNDTAKVLVKNPWPEAEALITVERAGIMMRRQMTLRGSAATIEIPIKDNYIPNVFASVTLIRGRSTDENGSPIVQPGADAGRPDIRVGYVRLNVHKKSKALSVQIKTDKEEYRPREKVKVAIQVNDHQGKGTASEVAVWAVDEGVLRLTSYSLPDILSSIYSGKGLSLKNASSLIQLIISRVYGDKGVSSGGSGGKDASGSGFRNKFVTTPLFTTVEVDDSGAGTVEFELPDNLTTYRLMAVAVTKRDLFGGGESSLMVSKSLLAMPAMPRFALSGDSVESGVVLHKRTAGSSKVVVKAQAEGVKLLEKAEKTITLHQGKPQEVRFKFRALTPGESSFKFQVANAEGDTDAVMQKFPIKLPVQRMTFTETGSTTSQTTFVGSTGENVLPNLGKTEVTYASTLLAGLDSGMRQLVEYPYGCAEQLSSRLVPFVVLRGLFGKFGVPYEAPGSEDSEWQNPMMPWFGEETLQVQGTTDPDEVVKKTITAIQALQSNSGGFRYWPSSATVSPDASVYATLALGRAAAVGYDVDKDALTKAKKFLTAEIASGKFKPCQNCFPVSTSTRIFALYALARLGEPQASYYPGFFTDRGNLSLGDKAMLTAAISVSGTNNQNMAGTLIDEFGAMAQETPSEIHFATPDEEKGYGGWDSTVRRNALLLEALVDQQPNHPWVQKLTNWLIRSQGMDGAYRTTQEAAFSLMALGEVSSQLERDKPDFTARTFLGTNEIASQSFSGHSMKLERIAIPEHLFDPSEANQIRMVRDGTTGTLRYTFRRDFYPNRMETVPIERGLTVQRWIEPWNKRGQQTRGIQAGELVRIVVRVATPMRRHHVALNIPLPAGLEAIDTTLSTTANLPEENQSKGNTYDDSFFQPFYHKELRDDRILAFAEELPAGIQTLEFAARATTPGDFQLMRATAEEMYAPEVFGRSDGGTFSVVLK